MSSNIQGLASQVDRERLKATVIHLATGERHGLSSPKAHTTARDYIRETFQSCGLQVREHAFSSAEGTGVNLVAHMAGKRTDIQPLLVSAHYDTVPGSPGADDNASGVEPRCWSAPACWPRYHRTIQWISWHSIWRRTG